MLQSTNKIIHTIAVYLHQKKSYQWNTDVKHVVQLQDPF